MEMARAYYKAHKRMKFDHACKDDLDRESAATRKALALPEILQEIFKYFDVQDKGRAAQVSRLWRDAIERPQLWSSLTALLYYEDDVPYQYKITHSELSWGNRNFTQNYKRSFPFITKLVVHRVTDKAINLVIQRFPNLTSLKLVAQFCGGCKIITDKGFAALCVWNRVASIGDVPTLLSLSLSGIRNLTNESLKILSSGQPALQTLDLSGCINITSNGLQYLIRLVDLRVLNIARCPAISDDGAVYLAQMAKLTDLDMSNNFITRAGLKLLVSGKSQLRSLAVKGCKMLDDTCGQMFAQFMHLTKLDLSATNIGDAVLKCLADGPGALTIETMFLKWCCNLTNKAGLHMARMRNLRVVHLDLSPVGDVFLSHLASAVDSRIEVLSLRRRHLPTDARLSRAFQMAAKRIQITDASLTHILRLPRLRNVFVCHCDFFEKWKQSDSRITVPYRVIDCVLCMCAANRWIDAH